MIMQHINSPIEKYFVDDVGFIWETEKVKKHYHEHFSTDYIDFIDYLNNVYGYYTWTSENPFN